MVCDMDLQRIQELLKLVAEGDVAELEIEEDGVKVTIRKNTPNVTVQPAGFPPMFFPQAGAPVQPAMPATAPVATPTAPVAPQESEAPAVPKETADDRFIAKAPIVGTLYRAGSPDSDAFVEVGSHVSVGDTLCIIEAMKLMNEIESDVSGTVVEVFAENGQPVEYDQPLFAIDVS